MEKRFKLIDILGVSNTGVTIERWLSVRTKKRFLRGRKKGRFSKVPKLYFIKSKIYLQYGDDEVDAQAVKIFADKKEAENNLFNIETFLAKKVSEEFKQPATLSFSGIVSYIKKIWGNNPRIVDESLGFEGPEEVEKEVDDWFVKRDGIVKRSGRVIHI